MTMQPDGKAMALSPLQRQLMAAAIGRTGCMLKPFPAGAEAVAVHAAIDDLVSRSLAHGGRSPNLTVAGRDVARQAVRASNPIKGRLA